MAVHPFTAFDRDYVVAEDLRVTPPGGTPAVPDTTLMALVPAGRRPSASTSWRSTVARPGGPGLLVAGEQADDTADAVVITQSMDAYVQCTLGGVTVVQELGRVPYRP